MATVTDKDLIAFKAISSFVDELSELFEKKQHSLKLYKRLISKTTLVHESAIIKHIETFKAYCIVNREPIKNRMASNLQGNIEYSTRVYIDLKEILSYPDNDTDTIDAIWNHMLAISAIVDPVNKTKEILKKRMKKNHNPTSSSKPKGGMELITNLMGSLQSQIGENQLEGSDPMKLISNIMSSGVFTNMISRVTNSIKDQKLDLNELMSMSQNMLSNLKQQDTKGEMPDIQSIMSTVMSSMATTIQPQESTTTTTQTQESTTTTCQESSMSTTTCQESSMSTTTCQEQETSLIPTSDANNMCQETTLENTILPSLQEEMSNLNALSVVTPLSEDVEFSNE